jgi:uncharacterized protein (DUF2062 family)
MNRPRAEPPPHHEARRRARFFLQFMPRRAVFHKYPLVGRFADAARKRSYLWSFKRVHLRPAFYGGSILALLPLMGVQLPLALILSFILRANFMVLGGLQFLTTPFTAAPIYYATHQLGRTLIAAAGYGKSVDAIDPITGRAEDGLDVVLPDPAPGSAPVLEVGEVHWTAQIGDALNALIVGGVVAGLMLGLLLDLLDRILVPAHDPKRRRHRPAPPPS